MSTFRYSNFEQANNNPIANPTQASVIIKRTQKIPLKWNKGTRDKSVQKRLGATDNFHSIPIWLLEKLNSNT